MNVLPNRWRILALVGVAQLMLILDVTVVALALPDMQVDLGMSREALTWVVSGYTLMFGGLLLVGGRATDLLGARRVLFAGLSLFGAASLAAGLAESGTLMLAGRVTQGAAAAMLSPAALSLVVTIFDGEERNRALGIWSALGGTGAALGVLLGGALTAGPGWPWVFFVNVPIAVVLIALLRVRLPALPAAAPGGRVDAAGAALATAATGTLIYALIQAGEEGWLTVTTLLLAAVSVALYGAFVARQRTTAAPLVTLRVLQRREVAVGLLLIFVATAMLITIFLLGTFHLQQERGYGALETGLLFLPVALATMAGANVAGRLLGQVGARVLGVGGLALAAVGMAVPAVESGTVALVIAISIVGSGTGVTFVVASATALGDVEPEHAGMASGALSTFHEFGASLGAAVVSSTAAATFGAASGGGFADGFTVAAAAAGAAALLALAVIPPRGVPESA